MANTTPAQLSLELNVSQRRIRDFLRDRHGTLPADATRWQLDDAEADAVREHFADHAIDGVGWTLEPGDTVLRRELHNAYGGSRQNGIVTFPSRPDILAFTDVTSGAPFGYDVFEGLQEDGSYAYTGEGQRGDQEFTRGNKAVLHSAASERPIRLFTVQGTSVTYVGQFTTGEPAYNIDEIPDADGHVRRGIIFRLTPVDADVSLLSREPEGPWSSARVAVWSPPDPSDVLIVDNEPRPSEERVVSRIEFALQRAFGDWLTSRGEEPARLLLTSHGTTIEPDFYVPARSWIVEAKKSSGREYVRTAIGQVLDYVNVAEHSDIHGSPVILLPGRPTPDLLTLMHRHGITLVVQVGDDFEVIPPGNSAA